MAFSKYNKGRPFLVANLIRMVPKGAKTHMKDYGTSGQWQMGESVSIEDSIKDRHMVEAAVIIDILKARVVKNRLEETDKEVMTYFVKKYNKEMQEGIQIWMRKEGMTISEKQIQKIEKNIDKPDIIALTLEEGDSPDISEKVVKDPAKAVNNKPTRKPRKKAEPKAETEEKPKRKPRAKKTTEKAE